MIKLIKSLEGNLTSDFGCWSNPFFLFKHTSMKKGISDCPVKIINSKMTVQSWEKTLKLISQITALIMQNIVKKS